MDEPILEIDNIHAYYGNIHALRGVSLLVNRGEIVTLVGNNGSGKTTLLNTVSGILKSREGHIIFDGNPISNLPAHQVVLQGISQVPEGRKIFSRLTVYENLEMGAFTRRDGKGVKEDIKSIFRLFPHLNGRKRQVAGTLSGGEQQMLAMGRALMARPRLLLLDEPSMGLAPIVVDKIFETIKDINNEGTTILLVEQNASMAFEIAARGYVIQTGSIVMEDRIEKLQQDETVRKLYLGIEG